VVVTVLRAGQLRYPDDFWINEYLAFILTQAEPPQLDEAIGFYRAALALRPKSVGVYINLGEALRSRGKRTEAEAVFRKAVALEPDYYLANSSLGFALLLQGKPAESEAAYRKAIALKPDDAQYHLNLGFVLLGQKKLAEAEAACRKAIELKPGDAEAYTTLGAIFGQQGKLTEAEAACRMAIKLKPDNASAYGNLGLALEHQDRWGEAEAAYRENIKLAPAPNPHGYCRLAAVLSRQSRVAEAVAAYRKGIELHPRSVEVHNNLAGLLADCPDPKFREPAEAVRLANRAVELAPENRIPWNTLGLAHYRAGDWKAALDALHKAMDLSEGGESDDWFFLAMAHWQLGQRDEARQWYARAAEWMQKQKPHDDDLRRFRAVAGELLGLPAPAPPAK
jgi:tetratricopeptide (TPR) repeat protein